MRELQSGELDHPSHRQASELQLRSIFHSSQAKSFDVEGCDGVVFQTMNNCTIWGKIPTLHYSEGLEQHLSFAYLLNGHGTQNTHFKL